MPNFEVFVKSRLIWKMCLFSESYFLKARLAYAACCKHFATVKAFCKQNALGLSEKMSSESIEVSKTICWNLGRLWCRSYLKAVRFIYKALKQQWLTKVLWSKIASPDRQIRTDEINIMFSQIVRWLPVTECRKIHLFQEMATLNCMNLQPANISFFVKKGLECNCWK